MQQSIVVEPHITQIPSRRSLFRLLRYFQQPRGLFVNIRKIVEHVKDFLELPEIVIRPQIADALTLGASFV